MSHPKLIVPAFVPTDDGGFDLEWRGGKSHIRIAINPLHCAAWVDVNSEGADFQYGNLSSERLRAHLLTTLKEMSDTVFSLDDAVVHLENTNERNDQ